MKYSSDHNSECQWYARANCASGVAIGFFAHSWIPDDMKWAFYTSLAVVFLTCIGLSVRAHFRTDKDGEE